MDVLKCVPHRTSTPSIRLPATERDRAEIVNSGGISVALATLRTQPKHSGIQEQGLMLLAIIGRHRADAAIIREQRGEEVAKAVFTNLPQARLAIESAQILLRTIDRLDAVIVADLRPYYER